MSVLGATPRAVIYAVFTLSGFAGLIYESIWSHYLKLLLGHAAYAQTLVLLIFLGGMAAGAWLAAGLSRRIARPLLAYVVVEAVLGLVGLGFHSTFQGMQAWLFDTLIPQLDTPLSVDVARWGLGTLLILPQSILLGATFPLISAGLIRLYPQLPGQALGWLYFTNSLGAAVGVLVSGFYLIELVGLPGTILSAALLNFAVALAVYSLQRTDRLWKAGLQPLQVPQLAGSRAGLGLMLAAAALTGSASFFYEIGWIRMLSLVLGSATHSFELMLSAFIFGLAMGSLYIRNRIDRARNPMAWLGWIQLIMALFAVLSLPLYMITFDLMAGVLQGLDTNEAGYRLFVAFSHGICFVLMLPATFCAGMTLPLITATLLKSGHGEASIGRVYAVNTFGAIVGILLAVHVVMPMLGLKQVVAAGAVVDLMLGLWLLRKAGVTRRWERGAIVGACAASIAVVAMTRFDPAIVASGVFRHGISRIGGTVIYYSDGKTATVSVARGEEGTISIATNGKVDAGLNAGEGARPDEYTTVLLAVTPLAFHPQARSAAVIGMGSGMTTHALLKSSNIEHVDTIEIEPAMVEGARLFGDLVRGTFEDPRSHIRIEDAKAYFARARRRYDLIISEPSNPWVSGVASLFSVEFYEQVQRYLEPSGLFVQWMHLYEIDPPLVASVMNALGETFQDYAIYVSYDGDMLIVASHDRDLPPTTAEIVESPQFEQQLKRLAIANLSDLELRRLGTRETLQPLFESMGVPANSDYFPILDQKASRPRFVGASARALLEIYPYSGRLEGRVLVAGPEAMLGTQWQPIPDFATSAGIIARRLLERPAEIEGRHNATMDELVGRLRVGGSCPIEVRDHVWLPAFTDLVLLFGPYMEDRLAQEIVARAESHPCYGSLGETDQQWIRLLRAMAESDWAGSQQAASALYKAGVANRQARELLLAELLLADFKAEGHNAVKKRVAEIGRELPDTMPIRYLRAYADSHWLN